MKSFSLRLSFVVNRTLVSAAAALAMVVLPMDSRADAPAYSIDFHTISGGGSTLSGTCYRLSATVAQVAPGYSSASMYSIGAGYWQPSQFAATDEIFFNGFEGC